MAEAAGSIAIAFTIDASNFTGGSKQLMRMLRQVQGEADKTQKSVRGIGKSGLHSISDLQATSASLRLLEGGITNSLRAAERFASRLPGLSSALQAAFPVVGAVALTAVIYRAVDAFSKFEDAAKEAPREMEKAMDKAAISMNSHLDELLLRGAKLQAQFEKLRLGHVSGGTMAQMQALQRKGEHDKAAGYITSTTGVIRNELKPVNFLQSVAGAGAANTDQIHGIQAMLDSLDAQSANLARLPAGSPPGESARKAIMASILADIANLQQQRSSILMPSLNAVTGYMRGNDTSSRVDALSSAIEGLTNLKKNLDAESATNTLQAKVGRIGKNSDHSVQQQMAEYRAWRAAGDRSKADEAVWWNSKRAFAASGSPAFQNATKEYQQAMIAVLRENTQELKKFHDLLMKVTPTTVQLRPDKSAATWIDNVNNRIPEAQFQGAWSAASAQTDLMRRMGLLNPHEAAVRRAKMNTYAYQSQLEGIHSAMSATNSETSLSPLAKRARLSGLQLQATQLTASYAQQHLQDQAMIQTTSTLGTLNTALAQFATKVTDAGAQLSRLSMGALNASNQALVGAMQGEHGTFKGLGRSLVGMGTTSVLQGTEGAFLRGIGIKGHGQKALGTKSNPMYVLDASPAAQKVQDLLGGTSKQGSTVLDKVGSLISHPKSIFSGLASHGKSLFSGLDKLFGGSSGSGSTSGGGAGGGIMSNLISGAGTLFQGFFAEGGSVVGNVPAMVGERGPELFVPHTHGTIVPNHGLGGPTIHIDARATNPAMVQSAVHRGMALAYAGSVHTSLHQHHDMARRRP